MTKNKFFSALCDIDETVVKEAESYKKSSFKYNMVQIASLAACLCLVFGIGAFKSGMFQISLEPNPELVQVVNPILEVESKEEMEKYLDFTIDTLNKPINSYVVLVIDGYPTSGRITYQDGSVYNKQWGTGDISGIYGGKLKSIEEIKGVKVSFYEYEDTFYAIWENNGFTNSLTGGEELKIEVETLIK